jgi:hypothetical protein
MSKPTKQKKTYLVDVHWDVAKCYRVEAESAEEAQAIIQKQMDEGELSYFDDGYESTDDTSVETMGEQDENGEEIYY